jgi:hypothetical protein
MAQTVTLRWPSSFLPTPTPRDAGKSNNTNKVENKESERYESVARHSRDEHRVLYTVAVVKYRRCCYKQAKKKEELGNFLVFNVIRAPHPPPSHININNIGGGRPRDLPYYYYYV